MNSNKRVSVVCAIIEKDEKILVAQRNRNQTNAGLWEFPGGKVDPTEQPAEALSREIKEELGADITVTAQLSAVQYDYSWISIELIPFVCKISSGIILPIEHSQVRFVTIQESINLEWAPADIPVLKEYIRYCKKDAD
ncbi:MAG: (deoxy)nucleoside triphosphate pyrophosphohydrolase [Fibrobacter sp.]|nr:(deoxy)nucleoside triphosphate pyrophosphohydrolase [Fibrobacter sp.]